jgi:hypothetical protein
MASHGKTLARALCYGEEPHAIARWLNICYIIVKNLFKKSSELQIHYEIALPAIPRKEHSNFLA